MSRFSRSFVVAWKGIWKAFNEQLNLKIHILVAIVVIGAGFYYRITDVEWLAVTLSMGFVLAAELINTAIEYIVDLVSPQHQPLAGKIKDVAAGAVLVAVVTSIAVGIIIFFKYLFPNT